ncbi:MAG: tRNA dihydrouridine synthase DusB, partial [Clostridia bacterium]|nr:tRNA dihydrouridine synthase DusB [Clostridia bacterium]
MKIKNVEIKGFAALAPMAGVADRAMREICVTYGAGFTVGELTSARGVILGDKKSSRLLECFSGEAACASQLFGRDPYFMAEAAKAAAEFNPDFIDINMGCPAPKVAGHGGGSALMKEPKLAAKIVEEAVNAVDVPITVKMRAGWDNDSLNAVELARMCEAAGAQAITVHGRTRKQMYAPPVNYDIIRDVKKAVKIPVIANGDVQDAKSAKFMYEYTGCDYVMVGRGAQGNPFVFEEINAFFEGRHYKPPTLAERFNTCLKQIELMHKYKDPKRAILESRKHTAWYLTGLKGAAAFRKDCGEISSIEDVKLIFEKALEQN